LLFRPSTGSRWPTADTPGLAYGSEWHVSSPCTAGVQWRLPVVREALAPAARLPIQSPLRSPSYCRHYTAPASLDSGARGIRCSRHTPLASTNHPAAPSIHPTTDHWRLDRYIIHALFLILCFVPEGTSAKLHSSFAASPS